MQSEERRRLIQQQDIEFQKSLMADRQKELRKNLEKYLKEYYENQRRDLLHKLSTEFYEKNPEISEDIEKTVLVVLRLPNGSIISYRFLENRTIGDVRDFVNIQYLNGHDIPDKNRFDIIQNFPLIVYGDDVHLYHVLKNQSGSRRRVNLFVREKITV
jgi:hypothetical protein